jgi:radical SAM protein with 4Fe4S-binding SPASM domain
MNDRLAILSVILTNRCNLKCVYCGRNENEDNECIKNELTNEEWLKIFEDGKNIGLKKVNMTGGEIFCRKGCIELIEKTINLGLEVSIETNGTIIDEKQIKYLSKLKDNLSISISLDGIKKETNDLTRGEGAYEKTFKAINMIKNYAIPLRIITVLSKNNYDEIPELTRTIHEELGLGFRLLPNIIEYGKGVEANEEHGLPYPKIKELMDGFYYDFLREHANNNNLTVELNMAIIPIDIYRHSFCPWGKAMLGIGYSGNVALCHVAADNNMFVFDNVRNKPISEIWENNIKLLNYKSINPDDLKGICGNCLGRHLCRGGCRLHALTKYHGDFYAPDPQCQNIYEIDYFPKYAMEEETKDCEYIGVE